MKISLPFLAVGIGRISDVARNIIRDAPFGLNIVVYNRKTILLCFFPLKPTRYHIKTPRYHSFGDGINKIVNDHKQMLEEEEAERINAERNERARRQFLLFLFFAIQVASIIYRDEINTATAALYARCTSSKQLDPRHTTFAKAEAKIKGITKDAQQRQGALDEIVPGLGSEATAERSDATVDPDHPGRNLMVIKDKSKHRDKVLNEIIPGMVDRKGESSPSSDRPRSRNEQP